MRMRIIEHSRAPNPRRVRIFLAEKAITVPFEQIDIMQLDQRSAGFTALNPLQRVPVLVLDDGTAISESVAICRYFEETHPEPALFGATARERAVVEMWNRRVELSLLLPVSECFRHTHPSMVALEVPQIPAWAQVNRQRATTMLAVLDAELALHPFVAGAKLSIADITALVAVDFMKPARIERPAGLACLERWHAAMSARASAKA